MYRCGRNCWGPCPWQLNCQHLISPKSGWVLGFLNYLRSRTCVSELRGEGEGAPQITYQIPGNLFSCFPTRKAVWIKRKLLNKRQSPEGVLANWGRDVASEFFLSVSGPVGRLIWGPCDSQYLRCIGAFQHLFVPERLSTNCRLLFSLFFGEIFTDEKSYGKSFLKRLFKFVKYLVLMGALGGAPGGSGSPCQVPRLPSGLDVSLPSARVGKDMGKYWVTLPHPQQNKQVN